jgi:hypothetical protein
MRIKKEYSVSLVNILANKVFEKSGFARAGTAKHIQTTSPLYVAEMDQSFAIGTNTDCCLTKLLNDLPGLPGEEAFVFCWNGMESAGFLSFVPHIRPFFCPTIWQEAPADHVASGFTSPARMLLLVLSHHPAPPCKPSLLLRPGYPP